jgi:hypothetical protein
MSPAAERHAWQMLAQGVAKLQADCAVAGRHDVAERWYPVGRLVVLGWLQAAERDVVHCQHTRFIVASCRS